MVPNAPLEGTVLVTEELDHKEIKNHIKSALRSVPSDATLDLHPPMRPDDGFVEMVSAPTLPLPFFPWPFCVSFPSPDLGLRRLQGNLCLVPDFNPPLPEDMTQRARNRDHAEGVKKKKDEGKKKEEARQGQEEGRMREASKDAAVGWRGVKH
jgi:hypothetical protein